MVRQPVQPSVTGRRRGVVLPLGYYSPSQNGLVVSPFGIAPCLAGGGKGHDTDKPKILIEYNV